MDPDKKKTEIEIANELADEAVLRADRKLEKMKNVKDALIVNKANLYKWNRLEYRIRNGAIQTDEKILLELKTEFGEGMMLALIKELIPKMKENTIKAINLQSDILGTI